MNRSDIMINIIGSSETFGDSGDIFDMDNSIGDSFSGIKILDYTFNSRMGLNKIEM